jgi:hypothetical protein
MGATKESPATQVLEWAVGKLDEASKIDWVEKFNTLTASKPAYLRNGLLSAAVPSSPASAARGTGVSQADLDAAMVRAARAEAKAESLAGRVAQLERQLAALDSHDEAGLPPEESGAGDAEGDGDHKSHWWSRQH